MPPPAAPTGFDLVQSTPGKPLITLSWSHAAPADVDRFEVLRRDPIASAWESVVLAPKSDFGPGPYSFTVASPEGYQWAVRALNAAGEVST